MGVLNCTSYYKAISNEERKACFNNIYIYIYYIYIHIAHHALLGLYRI